MNKQSEVQGFAETRTVEQLGKAVHLVLNNTLSRTLTRREYERVVQDISNALTDSYERGRKNERERCLKALPPEYIIHGYMPLENTPARQGWNDYRMAAILALSTEASSPDNNDTV